VVEVMTNFHERCLERKEDRNLVKNKNGKFKETISNHDKNIHYSISA
jgi:hypothetical protein